jgi:RNA polymerase sigma-70 factor (ECF subfamily)
MADVPIDDPNLELFERWRSRGDTDALARVFDATAPRLLALAVHLAGNVPDAEDLVQATFLTAIERSASFDRTRLLEPWLTGILSNHARELRRSAERAQQVAPAPEREPRTPFDEAEEAEGRAVVAAAVDKLEEPYRGVLILATRHGMSPAEIAYALQRSPGAVRVQLHRGRELLRKVLPAGMVVGAFPARGLAAVRVSVLARAAVLGTALRAGSIAGGVLVGKKLVAALAVLMVALFVGLKLREGGVPHSQPDAPRSQAVANLESPPQGTPTPSLANPVERESRAEVSNVPPIESPTVRLHGRVVDADSGAGIAGAEMSLYAPRHARLSEIKRRWSDRNQLDDYGGLFGRLWPRFGGKPAVGNGSDGELSERARLDGEELEVYEPPVDGATPVARVRSDADGLFEIAAPEALGFLSCDVQGYARRQRALSPNEINRTRAGEVAITVAMRAPRRISGYIVDKDLQRIARRVRLAFFGHLSRSATVSLDPDGSFPKGRDPELDRQCDLWIVETRPDGSFECELPALIVMADCLEPDLTVAKEWLVASGEAPRRPLAWLQTGSTDSFALELAPVSSIRVRDRDSHAAIEYVHLLCKRASDGLSLRRGTYFARDGLLRLSSGDVGKEGMRPREDDRVECLCTVWADGYLPLTQRLPNLTDGYAVEFELERGSAPSIEGVVRDGARAVPDASIGVFENSSDGWAPRAYGAIAMATTDASGRFRLEAPAASYRMQLLSGENEEWRVVELPCSTPVVFDLAQDTRLVVGVHDAAGAACPGLPLLLRSADGRAVRASTDAAGSASFPRLPAGTQRIQAAETQGGRPENSEHRLVVELRAGEARRVEMTVSSESRHARLSVEGSTSLAGWRACVPKGIERPFVSVDADGRIPVDIRGQRALAIESPDLRQWQCLLPKDAPDGYSIRIVPDGPGYEGTLCDMRDGKPLANVRVIAAPWDDPRGTGTVAIGVTDAQGNFRIAGLREGKHYLRFEEERGWSRDFERLYVLPRAEPASPAPRLALVIPRRSARREYEQLDVVTIRGVLRRASATALPLQGALASEFEKPGYALRTYADFVVQPDGRYEVRTSAAPRFVASFWSDPDEHPAEITWSASTSGDTEVHDFELP